MFGGRLSQDEVGMNWALLGVEGGVSARVWPARVGGGGQRGAAPLGRLRVQVPPPAAVPSKGTWLAQDKVWGWRMSGSCVCGWHASRRCPLLGAGSVLAWLPRHKAAAVPTTSRSQGCRAGRYPVGRPRPDERPALALPCATGAASGTPKITALELRLATCRSNGLGAPVLSRLGGCGALWCLCRSPHRNPLDRLTPMLTRCDVWGPAWRPWALLSDASCFTLLDV